MKLSSKRAEGLSLVAMLLHGIFFLLLFLLAQRNGSPGTQVEAWHFLGGAAVWLVLLIQFHQRRLAEDEQLEEEQYERLRSEGRDTSVFEGKMAESSLQLARRRLVWIEKYLLTIFSGLIAVYWLAIGYWQYRVLRSAGPTLLGEHTVLLSSAAYLAGMALVSFLLSRYAVGLSQQPAWRPLRAGGGYLLSNALVCFGLAISLIAADAKYPLVEKIITYAVLVLMAAIGFEIILSMILDAYRPRTRGEYRRAAYESRLLGLFSEPGGIFRTAAHAIDYQFGFKVSETWFYKLLERAVMPLLAIQVLALYLMSCVAIVDAGNVGVLERFGRPLNAQQPYASGIHLKLPWPMDVVRMYPVEQLQIIEVGFERYTEPENQNKPVLWTEIHWKEEYPFMAAISDAEQRMLKEKQQQEETEGQKEIYAEAPLVRNDFDLLVVALVVHYKIADVAKYGYGQTYGYLEPRAFLESICNRATVHYAAHEDVETLMGPGRSETARILKEAIQAEADRNDLGVKILFAGLESVHPPVKVAESFEKVISAIQEKQAKVLKAQGAAREQLALSRGASSVRISEAEAYAVRRSQVTQAMSERFAKQVEAYEKGGEVYLWREYLSVLEQYLPAMRKYVVASSQVDSWVYEVDLKEKLEPDLFEGLGVPDKLKEQTK